MKLYPIILIGVSAESDKPSPPETRCPDFNLGVRCQSACDGTLFDCKANCEGDYTCETRCQASHLDCINFCPCGASCPDGCSGADDFCSSNEFCSYTDILVLNVKQAYQNRALVIDSLNTQTQAISFDYNLVDIEYACSVNFRGVQYFLGGFNRDRQIAKIDGCSIQVENELLSVPHTDGLFGSCAKYRDSVALCFDSAEEDHKSCWSWQPGTAQSMLPSSQHSHDWADMVNFRNELVTVGGCGTDIFSTCHSETEFMNDDGWRSGPNPNQHLDTAPYQYIRAQVMTADEEAVYLLTGKTYAGGRPPVQRLKDNKWEHIGKLNEASYTVNYVTSAIQSGYAWYSGCCSLEKTTYIREEFETETLFDTEPEGCVMELEYAYLFEVPARFCQL